MTSVVLDNWMAMSLLSAAAWALSCVIDTCFVAHGIYRKASDGTAIAGLFCLVPAMLAGGSLSIAGLSWAVIAVGMLSGVAFLLHIHFYFKALFALNDAVNAEIFNTLGVLFVPILAFLILGERLIQLNYLAIALGVVGILLLVRCQVSRLPPGVIGYLFASVASISLMMVMQAWVLQFANYATAVWLFSSTAFIAVLIIFGISRHRRRRVGKMCRRFGAVFISVQLLEIGAVLGSQRATYTGPSVSLVALVECTLPIFVMAFSWLLAVAATRWMPYRASAIKSALTLQTVAAPSKILSMLFIVFAVLLVQG